jgi:hypothetical protein
LFKEVIGGVSHRVTIMIVIRKGFEPLTYALEVRCSIQLSYQTKLPHLRFW